MRIGIVQKTIDDVAKQQAKLYKNHNKVEFVVTGVTFDNLISGYFIVD